MPSPLTHAEKQLLLVAARQGLEAAVRRQPAPELAAGARTQALERLGCCFVTLSEEGELRGCIGGLTADEALWRDVQHRAGQAALHDYRFIPVTPEELEAIEIEVSVLTEPAPLAYATADDLPRLLRPHIDGVVLRHGGHRATFLPQVWDHVSDPEQFLSLLCEKLGATPDAWRRSHLDVETYQVDEFRESDFAAGSDREPPPARPTP